MSVIQINKAPSHRQLKQFGIIWLGFFVAVGAVAWVKAGSAVLSGALWGLAVFVPVVGWLVPRVMRWVYLGMSYLAWPIGFVISHILLAIVYYLVFTPIGLVMRLFGYDPLTRRSDLSAESYWCLRAKADANQTRRYFRQF
jgi:hypothetical protein